MSDRKIDLNDPDCEPTLEDWKRLLRAAGDQVRAESRMLAQQQREQEEGQPSADGTGSSSEKEQ